MNCWIWSRVIWKRWESLFCLISLNVVWFPWNDLKVVIHFDKFISVSFILPLYWFVFGYQFAFAHDTARVLQCLIQYGSPEQKDSVYQEVKGSHSAWLIVLKSHSQSHHVYLNKLQNLCSIILLDIFASQVSDSLALIYPLADLVGSPLPSSGW